MIPLRLWPRVLVHRVESIVRTRLLGQCTVSLGMVCSIAGSARRAPLGFGMPQWLGPGQAHVFRTTVGYAVIPDRLMIVTTPEQVDPPCVVEAVSPAPMLWPAGTEVEITIRRAERAS